MGRARIVHRNQPGFGSRPGHISDSVGCNCRGDPCGCSGRSECRLSEVRWPSPTLRFTLLVEDLKLRKYLLDEGGCTSDGAL